MPNLEFRSWKHAFVAALVLSSVVYAGCAGSSATPAHSSSPTVSAIPFQQNIDIDLSSSTAINPSATFTLSNRGNDPIVMPTLVPKGTSALNRSSILFPLQGLKNKDLALATWQFVANHMQHYCTAGAPGNPDDVTSEPMQLLNGFGIGCCEQNAEILTFLWQGAGYQARLVWMPWHEVPEIFYEGAWHMFDGDHHVYYLQLDNQTVASVADVIANPYLVARVADANGNDPIGYPAQSMADQYATTTPVYVPVDYKIERIYSLQPGQSMNLSLAQIVPVFHGPFTDDPILPPAATGSFDWNIDYSNPKWLSLTRDAKGVTTFAESSQIFLTNEEQNGFVVYEQSGPFPAISVQLSGLVELTRSGAAVKAYVSTDGVTWSAAFPLAATPGIPAQASVDLSSFAAGQYTYFVKLQLSGDAPRTARIANVHIVSQFQDSIFAFPSLAPGQVNQLTYQDWSLPTAEHNVTVSFSQQ